MEALWDQLSRPDADFESPAWHTTEVAETERQLAQGKELTLDWETAKKELRRRFELKSGFSPRRSSVHLSSDNPNRFLR